MQTGVWESPWFWRKASSNYWWPSFHKPKMYSTANGNVSLSRMANVTWAATSPLPPTVGAGTDALRLLLQTRNLVSDFNNVQLKCLCSLSISCSVMSALSAGMGYSIPLMFGTKKIRMLNCIGLVNVNSQDWTGMIGYYHWLLGNVLGLPFITNVMLDDT